MDNENKKIPIYCGIENSMTGRPVTLKGDEREKFISLVKGDSDRDVIYCPDGLLKQYLNEIDDLKKQDNA